MSCTDNGNVIVLIFVALGLCSLLVGLYYRQKRLKAIEKIKSCKPKSPEWRPHHW